MTADSTPIVDELVATPRKAIPGEDATSSQIVMSAGQEIKLLTVLTGTNFVVMTCINMLAPLLLELSGDFNTSIGAIGQLAAATAIPWAVLAPFMGALSDRHGRRPVLAFGLALLGLATIGSAFAWSYSSLLVLRLIGGIGGATTGPNLLSAPADYFPPHRSGRAMGLLLGGLSVATVIGVPAVAIVAALVGWRWSFAAVGLLLLALAIVVWYSLPKGRKKSPGSSYAAGFANVLSSKKTLLLLVANLMERCSFVTASTYLAAFLMQSYGLELDQIAPVLSVIAAGTLLGSVVGGRLADRGRQRMQYSLLLLTTSVLVFPVFATTPGLVFTAALAAGFGVFGSLARPAWLWMVTRVPPERRATTMGFAATSNQVGIVAGSALGGVLIGIGGYSLVGILAAAAAVISATTCALSARAR